MKVLIQKNKSSKWIDITEYVNGVININETVDGTFNTIKLQLTLPPEVEYINGTKPIPPKHIIKIQDTSETSVEGVNTFYFYTSDNNSARLRKSSEGNYDAIYLHEITGNGLIEGLDNKYLPNYTITQPKTEFYNSYTKNAGVEFILNQNIEQNGDKLVLNNGQQNILSSLNNNNNEINFGYDSVEKKHYVDFKEIDKAGLELSFNMDFAKSAVTTGVFKFLLLTFKSPIYTYNKLSEDNVHGNINRTSTFNYKISTYLYDGNFNKNNPSINRGEISYNSGEVKAEGILVGGDTQVTKVKELGSINSNTINIVIPKNESFTSCRIYFDLNETKKEYMGSPLKFGYYGEVVSDIAGFSNNEYVKSRVLDLVIKANTSAYDYELEEKKITILEFVEKAIFDYNLNTRNKVKLANDVKVLLDVNAKESEWGDYTLRELLERAFKYVGIAPTINYKNEISYVKTRKVSRYINLNNASGTQTEHLSDNYYDKVVSSSKNLVSQQDFVREVLPLISTDAEFSRITEQNAGFKSSNDIYFVSNAILYAPNLEITFTNGEKINTNIGKKYYWDITQRLYEYDIYEAFPNVKTDFMVQGTDINPRGLKDLLSQSNTIMYKSGSNIVTNLFNIPEYIPDYRFYHDIIGTIPIGSPEFSIAEMIIVLAFQELSDPFGANAINPDLKFNDAINYQLDLTYVPIFNELTTKYVSNMPNRKGLNWEKKLNINNKTISYQENEEVLRNEMELKGNVKTSFTEIYNKLSDVIPYNSIVNDDLYITTRNIMLSKNMIEVDYILQENFVLQNDDIGLSVNFERYNIPYEYVKRELMLENHLIFSRTTDLKYGVDVRTSGLELIESTLLYEVSANREDINGTLYAKMNIDDNLYMMRLAKLESRFTMILSGMFVDNYNAGYQKYSGINDLVYTTPYRYTNENGKFTKLSSLEIGFSTNDDSPLRLGLNNGEQYDVNLFPMGEYDNKKVDLDYKLYNVQESLMIRKDAREQIALTVTNYLENEDEYLKFYSFKSINKLGFLSSDIHLNDDIKLSDVNFYDFEGFFMFRTEALTNGAIKVIIISNDIDLFRTGIVFINEEMGNQNLVGVIKEPTIEGNELVFYITSSRYGWYDELTHLNIYNVNIGLKPNIKYGVSSRNFNLKLSADVLVDEDFAFAQEYDLDINLMPNVKYSLSSHNFNLKLGADIVVDEDFAFAENYDVKIELVPNIKYQTNSNNFKLKLGTTIGIEKTISKEFNLETLLIPNIKYGINSYNFNLKLDASLTYDGEQEIKQFKTIIDGVARDYTIRKNAQEITFISANPVMSISNIIGLSYVMAGSTIIADAREWSNFVQVRDIQGNIIPFPNHVPSVTLIVNEDYFLWQETGLTFGLDGDYYQLEFIKR